MGELGSIQETPRIREIRNIAAENGDMLTEMSTPMRPIPTVARRFLRSQGVCPEYPNVQGKTLEYKRRIN